MTVRSEGIGATIPVAAPVELRGRTLLFARMAWVVAIATALLLFAASVPAQYSRLSNPPPDITAQLHQAGLPPDVYAGYLTSLSVLFALVCCMVAALIVWYRRNDRIGLLGSLYLCLLGLVAAPAMQAVVDVYPNLKVPANLANFSLMLFLVSFFYVFPDGQFVPSWARIPVLVGAAGLFLTFVLTGALTSASTVEDPPGWMGMMMLVGTVLGIAAQIYRYFRISDPVQRQQTKWVLLGVSAAILTALVFAFAGSFLPTIGRSETGYDLTSITAVTLASLFIPFALGFSILRYRLWEIDLVINRALVYGALTLGLAGLYLLVIGGLEELLQDRARLPISLTVTAVVAVLFAPLRDRVQRTVNRLMYGERDDPYRVLTRVGEQLGTVSAPDAVLQAISETVATALKSPCVFITLREGEPSAPSRSVLTHAALRLPLQYQGETVGELSVAPRGPGERFSAADRQLLEDIARQIGAAAHAVRLAHDLQRSRERLVTAREEERRRLRRDLHDGLGPQLAALSLNIETIRNRFSGNPELDAALVDLTTRIGTTLADVRRLVYGLRPPALDELGLQSALRQIAAQYSASGGNSLTIALDVPESLPALSAAVEVAIYRIVQEALANVQRHSSARTCRLSLSLDGTCNTLRLEIVDDGRGLPEQYHAGVGLLSMRERAEELGGTFQITSGPSGGTAITIELPLPIVDLHLISLGTDRVI